MLEEQLKKIEIPPKGIRYIARKLSFLFQVPYEIVEKATKMIIRGENPFEYLTKEIVKRDGIRESYARDLARGIITDIYRMIEHKSWEIPYWSRLLYSGNLYKPLEKIKIVW